MLIIRSQLNDPYLNIAAEEFLLKNFEGDLFYVYINDSSVVVGKHQNVYAEADTEYLFENNIPIVRRLSGGGTVFHDNGNINFCFISDFSGRNENYFRRFTSPVMSTLEKSGLKPEYSDRNDLLLKGKKFSGNAQHIVKNRIMHHGTILFSTDVNTLSSSLKQKSRDYSGHSVRSVKSEVVNISEYLKMDISEMVDRLIKEVEYGSSKYSHYSFSEIEIDEIKHLADDKYRKWEWNFAYSPPFGYTVSLNHKTGLIYTDVYVKNGRISGISFKGNEIELSQLSNLLSGVEYRKDSIRKALMSINTSDYFSVTDNEEFIKILF